MPKDSVVFDASFTRATTMADAGWRVTFDLSEDKGGECAALSEMRDQNLVVVVMTEDAYNRNAKHLR